MMQSSTRLPPSFLTVASLTVAVACKGEAPIQPRASAPLDSAFSISQRITLEEAAGDSIGEIRTAVALEKGGLLVLEQFRPRVHLYDRVGDLRASYGTFGEGPGELKSIHGAAEAPDGALYVVDTELGRITVLNPDLTFRRVFRPAIPPLGPLHLREDGMILAGMRSRRGGRLHMVTDSAPPHWSAFPFPDFVHQQPYWINFASTIFAATNSEIVASNGIAYPLITYDFGGDSIGSFGAPPPSFARIPEVPPGAFRGGLGSRSARDFVESFTVIGGLHVLQDSLLVVAHSRYESHPIAFALRYDYALDIYRLHDRVKLFEDVALPPEARVLTGGDRLYVLVSRPPRGWVVLALAP